MGKKHDRTHGKIVAKASKLFRERGAENVAVDEIMAAAGLTRGGFYAHFSDKESLVAEAIDDGFSEAHKNMFGKDATGAAFIEHLVRVYLTDVHARSPGKGCVVAALASDVARGDGPARDAFDAGLFTVLETLRARLSRSTRKEAIALFSTLVGALLMARATKNATLSRELIDSARDVIREQSKHGVYTSLPGKNARNAGPRRKLSERRTR